MQYTKSPLFFQNLYPNILGGITVAVVALPLALAFGVASGAGAMAGLYSAICVGFFAAIFGGTPTQVSGPTGPMTVVMALILTHFAHAPMMAFTVVIMGGIFQIMFGLLKFGRFINFMPYPVISGFMSGIGCIIIIIQLAPLFGHEYPIGSILLKLTSLPNIITQPEMHALILGAVTLLIVYLTPSKLAKWIPSPLIALLAGSFLGSVYFSNADVIGEIPSSLPMLVLPSWSLHDFPYMLRSALLLAFLGSIDSLLTSLVADSLSRSHHNSNKELIGQGIGNIAAGLVGAIPGAGATMRTVVNIRAGGNSPVSGATHAITLLILVLGFGGFASHIPLAVLAGILLKVGIDIIDWRYIKRLRSAPVSGVIIMLTTLILTVVIDLVTAVGVGMVMSCLLFVKRMADTQLKNTRRINHPEQLQNFTREETEILEQANGRIVLFQIEGPMSFGSAKNISRMLMTSKDQDILIIDMSSVPFIDSSGSIALEESIQDAHHDNDIVILCGLSQEIKDVLYRFGILKLLHEDCIVNTRLHAMRKAGQLLRMP